MTYPVMLDEFKTLELLHQGYSIARYGDGELNLCHGLPAKLQHPDPKLADRLKEILAVKNPDCLVGIPRLGFAEMPQRKKLFWAKYTTSKYTDLYKQEQYASAFITRPDSAPMINVSEYWHSVFSLWRDKEVLLVQGERSNFNNVGIMGNARSISVFECPVRNAFDCYDLLLQAIKAELIGKYNPLVVLSLGATATVLAWDLSKYVQALDLGHLSYLYNKCFIEGLEH